jgi:Golgi nucleoside diphosphatase
MAKDKTTPSTAPVYDKNGVPYNYVVIVDAGSSGSRVHVYSYPDTSYSNKKEKGSKTLEARKKNDEDDDIDSDDDDDKYKEAKGKGSKTSKPKLGRLPVVNKQGQKWVHKINPGMSSFVGKADMIGQDHLAGLLKYVETVIPAEQHVRTPIFIHATGGMRLLEESQKKEILGQSCDFIKKTTKFYLPDCNEHVNIITGDTEGIFGWLAVNYLVGGLQNPEQHDHGKNHSTYGFLEMGGASTQVTFVPNKTEIDQNFQGLYTVNLGVLNSDKMEDDLKFQVSSKTFLGLGVNEVQKQVFEKIKDSKENPCDPKGLITYYDSEGRRIKSYKGKDISKEIEAAAASTTGTGDFEKCQQLLEPIAQQVKSDQKVDFDFSINHLIGVSEYWDTTHDGFQMGGRFDGKRLKTKLKQFCESSWDDIIIKNNAIVDSKANKKKGIKKQSESSLQDLCIRTSWILEMIEKGLGLPNLVDGKNNDQSEHDETLTDYLNPLQSVEKINGVEYSWTLGRALMYATAEQNYLLTGLNNSTGLFKNSDISDDSVSPLLEFGIEQTAVRPAFTSSVEPPSGHKGDNKSHDDDDDDNYDWEDMFEHHSKRVWGSLLFLLILIVILYLLLGKVRRAVIWQSIKTRAQRVYQTSTYKLRGGSGSGPAYSLVQRNDEDDLELQGLTHDADDDHFSVNSDENDTESSATARIINK